MEKKATFIDGAWLIEPQQFFDNRGFFSPLYAKQQFEQHGLQSNFDRVNSSYSEKVGTLRGMHYQSAPFEEAKLIRVLQGALWDVVLDLRKDSPSFGKHFGVELTSVNRKMVYIPPGCAHGFITLAANTEVLYLASSQYQPSHERGIRWDDPSFSIKWPLPPSVISDKDNRLPFYAETT